MDLDVEGETLEIASKRATEGSGAIEKADEEETKDSEGEAEEGKGEWV